MLSFIKEIINIPLIEINQLIFILWSIYFLSTCKGFKIQKNSLNILILGMFFWMTIQGLFFVQNLNTFLNVYVDYFICLSIIMICSHLKISDYENVLNKICMVGTAIFLFEWILCHLSNEFYDILFYRPYAELRNVASFLSPNSYAIIIAFLMLYHFHFILYKHNKLKSIVLFGLLLLPLFTTYSKSGIVILGLGLLSEIFLYKGIWGKLFCLISVITMACLVFTNKIVEFLTIINVGNNYYIRRFIAYFESGTILSGRKEGYEHLINIIKDNFLFGVGFGNLTNNSSLFSDFSTPHNEYLRFLSEGGILGLIIIGSFVVIMLTHIKSVCRLKEHYSEIWTLIVTFAVMFLASEMFYNYWGTPREGMLLSFFTTGVLINCEKKISNSKVNGGREGEAKLRD